MTQLLRGKTEELSYRRLVCLLSEIFNHRFEFQSTEDTNILFGPGHTYSNNAATNKYKTRGRHNQCEANRSHQVLTFEPFPEMEGNWHLHRQSECSIHFRPGTGHSGRSSPRPPTNLSRRSSLASRIQSTTFRYEMIMILIMILKNFLNDRLYIRLEAKHMRF